jgi:hypothetical protein
VPKLSDLLSEAIYGSPIISPIDQDENQYRRLTQARRDLPVVEQARMIEWAAYLFQHNPLARRLIEIQRDWILGEGISIQCDSDAVRGAILGHWHDTVNDWPVKGNQRFIDLRLFGEACWTVAVTPGTGTVKLGVVDPSRIRAVVRDADQIDEADHVVLNAAYVGGPEQKYKVIREAFDTGRLEGADPDDTTWDGSCFYFAINKVATASRGISDLFALIDYIDGADQFLWSQLERAKLQNAQIFDVTVEGGPTDVEAEEKRIRTKQPTRPGTINVHTKTVTWQLLSPDLKAVDNAHLAQSILRWVLGGLGIPETWFGTDKVSRGGGDAEMDPANKRLTAIQQQWKSVINYVLRYQYEQSQNKGVNLPELQKGSPYPWIIEAPDMQVKDLAKLGAMINQMVVALTEAEAQEYISKESARRTYLQMMKLFGTDTDPNQEQDRLSKQPAKPAPDYSKVPNPLGQAPTPFGSAGQGPTAAEKSTNSQNSLMNKDAMTAGVSSVSPDTIDETSVVIHPDSGKLKKKTRIADSGDDLPDSLVVDETAVNSQVDPIAEEQKHQASMVPAADDSDESRTVNKKRMALTAGLVAYASIPMTTKPGMYDVKAGTVSLTRHIEGAERVLEVMVQDGTPVIFTEGEVTLPRGVLEVLEGGVARFHA